MSPACTHWESPFGPLLLRSAGGKLNGLFFADQDHAPARPLLDHDLEIFQQTRAEIAEFAAGTRRSFTVPYALYGTPFQMQVWQEIASIPYGATLTYAEIAVRIGMPCAARAVGMATGRNPLSLILPCHRVVGIRNSLTGYAGGLERKRRILQLEGTTSLQTAGLWK